MTAKELDESCPTYVALQTGDMKLTQRILAQHYDKVKQDEAGWLRVYDFVTPEEIAAHLYENGIVIREIKRAKIGLEEYYIDLMGRKR